MKDSGDAVRVGPAGPAPLDAQRSHPHGGTPPDAQTLDLELAEDGSAAGTIDRVTATAATGIVAVDDGGTWAGVSGLPLPYP